MSQPSAGPGGPVGPVTSYCPFAPSMVATNPPIMNMPSVHIHAGDRLPWGPPGSSHATHNFDITGCYTSLLSINDLNHVEWFCPQASDRNPNAWTMASGAALLRTPAAQDGDAAVLFQHFNHRNSGGQLRQCFTPPSDATPLPDNSRPCAQCPSPANQHLQRVPLSPVGRNTFFLHGCLSAGKTKVCSWLDLPPGIDCLGNSVVKEGFICGNGSSMPTVDSLYASLRSIHSAEGGSTKDRPDDRTPVGSSPSDPSALAPVDSPPAAGSNGRWVPIVLPLLAFVGGLALGALFLIHRRRTRRRHNLKASQMHPSPSYPMSPQTPPSNQLHLSSTPAPAANHFKPSPAAASSLTRTSLPRLFDTTGLDLVPLASPHPPAPVSATESLQSLTDAWESLFLRLEHDCTHAARAAAASSTTAADICAVRAERNARLIAHMARAWPALVGAAPEDTALVADLRAVVVRMRSAYPTFELMGVVSGGPLRADAMVEYVGSEDVGPARAVAGEATRSVRMVWPGWFDTARQMVVAKARVVVE